MHTVNPPNPSSTIISLYAYVYIPPDCKDLTDLDIMTDSFIQNMYSHISMNMWLISITQLEQLIAVLGNVEVNGDQDLEWTMVQG